jgi:hypothetical protein
MFWIVPPVEKWGLLENVGALILFSAFAIIPIVGLALCLLYLGGILP